jgi:hypothetical protein
VGAEDTPEYTGDKAGLGRAVADQLAEKLGD